ncbi:CPBP family intramembrane metalloprotease [Pendulispora brunnea]|uniref:CPBP family intramembrane metalloprotease n=1 Tax=Pendulispora brunnea TaxID=2905690 RepID=A0ABZ2JWA1_9BACT
MTVAFLAFPLLPVRALIPLAAGAAAVAPVGRKLRATAAFHLACVACLLFATLGFSSWLTWPLPLAVAIAGYLAVTSRLGEGTFVREWLRRGRWDRGMLAWIAVTAIIPAVALVLWFELTHPDYSHLRGTILPPWPIPVLALGVVLFSIVNAALEELVYRGVLLHALDTSIKSRHLALVIQALAFGIAHIHGFPRGITGVALVFIYGIMMGIVRRIAGGMLAPWLAHIFADVTIGAILLVNVV